MQLARPRQRHPIATGPSERRQIAIEGRGSGLRADSETVRVRATSAIECRVLVAVYRVGMPLVDTGMRARSDSRLPVAIVTRIDELVHDEFLPGLHEWPTQPRNLRPLPRWRSDRVTGLFTLEQAGATLPAPLNHRWPRPV
ncbi:hypothetical protein GCM10010407_04570 [Rarobacter incanus]